MKLFALISVFIVCGCLTSPAQGTVMDKQTPSSPLNTGAPVLSGNFNYNFFEKEPILIKLSSTGQTPMLYQCSNLPQNLELDLKTGEITGSLDTAGIVTFLITVTNNCGATSQKITLIITKK